MCKHQFVETSQSPAYDGSAAINRFGYCRDCKVDMQSFGGEGRDGKMRSYKSHQCAKRAGVWGKRR